MLSSPDQRRDLFDFQFAIPIADNTPQSDKKMMLVTERQVTTDNSKLQIWKGTLDSKGTWWHLTLADETIPSANLGKAPAP